ncbi:MAG: hypothetical protein E7141_04365 [Rikenellaceae bacterium]|nr:hypothetical protein [Rikenellaceae bacterium]
MNRICNSLLAVILLATASCTNSPLGHERTHSFAEVERQFAKPGAAFRPAPFWVWNDKVTYEDIDRMLVDFKEQGFGGVYVHPRPGMITTYLTDEWFDLWAYSLKRAKELELEIWIYDENSYPSGFAGGHVPTEFPESVEHATELRPTIVEQLPEDLSPYCICLKQVGDKFEDITSSPRSDEKGRYFLYEEVKPRKKRWLGGFAYPDLLYKGTTECFIEITTRGYEKRFGKDFGKAIKGIFTDEAEWQRWTPDMFNEFEKEWGYNLRTHLPMLKEEIGNWKQVRFHFLATKQRLFIERWSMPWYNYCEEHNLLWTGHYWEHYWPKMNRNGDNMSMYEWHQQPGIDLLFNEFDEKSPNAHWGNVRAVKELRSAANQIGQTRTLCESYGGGGWEQTFEEFKRYADWQYALGVNYTNQHFSPTSTAGARKYDYPDFFTRYSPWWNSYKLLNDHVARLSLVLSQGEQMNDILVLEPNSTIWMYYTHRYDHPAVKEIGNEFQAFVTMLEKSQVEFDLGSEMIIHHRGKVKGGKFVVGNRAYSTVIIPANCENLFGSTAALLEQFVAEGGKIIALGAPDCIDGYKSEKIVQLWSSSSIKRELNITELANDHIQFSKIEGGNLFHHRREYKDGELLFLANASMDEYAKGSVTLCGAGLKVLDTYTGEILRDAKAVVTDGKVEFKFNIPPVGHLLVFAPKRAYGLDKLPVTKCDCLKDAVAAKATSDLKVRRASDNYLTLEFCDLKIDDTESRNIFVGKACQQLFKHFGLKNPWERTMHFKDCILAADTIKTGNITVSYHFNVAEKFDWSDMKFICEKPSLWEVRINGNKIEPIDGECPLDARNGSFRIGEYIRLGENVVTLHRSPMTIYAEIACGFVTGNFAVVPDKIGWKIAAPQTMQLGSWHKQGAPFYGWDVAYSRSFELPHEGSKIVKLGSWKGTVCEVWINGEKAGAILTKPYTLDITRYAKEGSNNIEVRCTGSLYNLYGPHFHNYKGRATPGSWYVNAEPTSAEKYQLFEYGLNEAFEVLVK